MKPAVKRSLVLAYDWVGGDKASDAFIGTSKSGASHS